MIPGSVCHSCSISALHCEQMMMCTLIRYCSCWPANRNLASRSSAAKPFETMFKVEAIALGLDVMISNTARVYGGTIYNILSYF